MSKVNNLFEYLNLSILIQQPHHVFDNFSEIG
jgi:hypothetical protein